VHELVACYLFGKMWGEALGLAAIINKTKKDWSFIKGQIFYVGIGNEWILVRFANVDDRNMVYSNRPWFVNSFNFVLSLWIPLFDPFNNVIDKVDQWIRISRLPW